MHRFVRLVKEKKGRGEELSKWEHSEDVQLLRGFQVFGEKWSLVSSYFLPHRNRRELRLRYVYVYVCGREV